MRVKVGDNWYEATVNQPIMVELSEADKRNITSMLPEATKYAEFHDDTPLSREDRFVWMNLPEEDAIEFNKEGTFLGRVSTTILHVWPADSGRGSKSSFEDGVLTLHLTLGNELNIRQLRGTTLHAVFVHDISSGEFITEHHEEYQAIRNACLTAQTQIQYL